MFTYIVSYAGRIIQQFDNLQSANNFCKQQAWLTNQVFEIAIYKDGKNVQILQYVTNME